MGISKNVQIIHKRRGPINLFFFFQYVQSMVLWNNVLNVVYVCLSHIGYLASIQAVSIKGREFNTDTVIHVDNNTTESSDCQDMFEPGTYVKAALSVTFDLLIFEIMLLSFKNTVKN